MNDPLSWLREKQYESVLGPFEKGLSHFVTAKSQPKMLSDVITDMYEALEALAKIVTGRDSKDLSANREDFVSKLGVSGAYSRILREYIAYANGYRHAAPNNTSRELANPKEVESFVYLTGLFIRLATGNVD